MRKKLVAGNWKMHGSLQANQRLVEAVREGAAGLRCDVALCVPFPYLVQVSGLLSGSPLALGAQTVSEFTQGAYTGEVSVAMLQDFGCRYVIIGHSERRTLFGETDQVVAEKCAAALAGGLLPIVCVGETRLEREAGQTQMVVARQLDAVLQRVGVAGMANVVIAYEPVWAIGTGLTASPAEAQAVHAAIRQQVAALDSQCAAGLQILYGGSVKPQNAVELFAQADIDGGLIGGAALVAEDFLAICQAAN